MGGGGDDIDLSNLGSNIKYLGTVPHSSINNYYAKSDVFILPSLAEGSALVIYEAMASSCPCIVTKNCGSVIKNGYNGFIIETQNVSAIVDAINKFLGNPSLVGVMGENASMAVSEYTWEKFEDKIGAFYKEHIIEH